MLKKVLSLLVCGIMTVAMTPAFAMADGGSAEREVSTLEELKTALNETNVEIKVNSDIQLDGELNIAKDKTITLNLNGHKLSCQKGNPKTKYAIDNQGTLTIEDKSAEANGTISSRGVSNNGTLTMKGGVSEAIDDGGGAGVWNEGDFVMTGGELKVTGKPVNNIAATPLVSAKADGLGSKVPTVRVSGGKFTSKYTNINIRGGAAEISNVNLSVTEKFWMAFKAEKGADVTLNKVKINAVKGGCADAAGGKVELNDCEFTQTEMADWNSTTLAASNGGVLTVNSGVYKGDATAGYGAYIFNSGGKINIKGGEITAKTVLKADKSTTSDKSEIEVSGGKFDGAIDIAEGSDLTVKGGTFKNAGDALNAYLAEGMEEVSTEEGTFIMSSEHKKIIDDLKAKVKDSNDKLEAANKEIEKLKADLEKEKTASKELQAKLNEAEDNLKKANAKVDELKEEVEKEKAASKELREKLDKAEGELKEANAKVTELKGEVEKQKKDLADKEQELSEANKKVNELQNQVAAEKKKAEEAAEALKEAKAEIDNIKKELQEQKESVDKLQKELDKAGKDIAKVKEELAEVQKQLEESNLKLGAAKKEAEELKTKLEAAEKKVAELEKEIKNKNEKSTEAEKQLELAKKKEDALLKKLLSLLSPSKIKAKMSKGKVVIKWMPVKDVKVDGYKVYRSAKSKSGYKEIAKTGKTKVTIKKLKKGKTYYFKIKAYKKIAGKTVLSKAGKTIKVKIK